MMQFPPNLSPEQIEMLAKLGMAGVGILGAFVSAVALPLIGAVLPHLVSRIKNDRLRGATQAVSDACLIAASAATKAHQDAMAKASAPGSDGGALVTEAEGKAALDAGVAAGLAALGRSGVLKSVIAIYGGEQAIRDALIAYMRDNVAMALAKK